MHRRKFSDLNILSKVDYFSFSPILIYLFSLRYGYWCVATVLWDRAVGAENDQMTSSVILETRYKAKGGSAVDHDCAKKNTIGKAGILYFLLETIKNFLLTGKKYFSLFSLSTASN